MPLCCRCKKTKNDSDFNFKHKALGIREKACRECTQSEVRKHYYSNRDYYLEKAKARNNLTRNTNKKVVMEYLKIHPCVDCGETDPIVLEFDHLHDKNESIARMMRTNSLNSLYKEIDKCEVRCANCHRRKTSKQFGWVK